MLKPRSAEAESMSRICQAKENSEGALMGMQPCSQPFVTGQTGQDIELKGRDGLFFRGFLLGQRRKEHVCHTAHLESSKTISKFDLQGKLVKD